MLLIEKKLVHKGYIPTNKTDKLLSFHKKGQSLEEFNIEIINNKYKVSFPIGDIQYTTTIEEKTNMIKYIEYILQEHNI